MPYRAVVLTISDSRSAGSAADRSGPAIIEQLPSLESVLVHREIVPDDPDRIRDAVKTWIGRCEIIFTTGGTGVAARDVTPEAIRPLIERALPGFGEVMRMRAFEKTPLSIVSRGGAGVANNTLMVWLPGSPAAATECIEWLAPAIRHVAAFLRGDTPH